jgi:hypothetical protein
MKLLQKFKETFLKYTDFHYECVESEITWHIVHRRRAGAGSGGDSQSCWSARTAARVMNVALGVAPFTAWKQNKIVV